ncbi:MAG TPA: tRNA uridine-5-carboxymethylaminomethyl(34) synthesis GTPase MnmE [Burkholderiales bacterium]|nr:tRNA uridine-5-carboxymethylaminomethyl(34) synthesis GTPase MnmE [Burkholderiales bacterium]
MRNVDRDCIAAIATAPGRAGVGVVRVSGNKLDAFARALTHKIPTPRHATYVSFYDQSDQTIDEGLLIYFPAPHSYTGEDVLELQAHGSPVVLQMLLRRCLALGARLAEPGEFTRRAYLNDKLDLAQAEAVADLIDASTESAARGAVRSLCGEFSAVVQALVQRLIELRMLVEAGLDFPEEEIESAHRVDLRERLNQIETALQRALAAAIQGSLLRSGLSVVLAGQPNVGKSSLLNRLAGEDLAIVTALPGTTRDTVRQSIQIEGVPLHLVDTAGIRESNDEVEQIGIARTWSEIERCDLLLLIVDETKDEGPEDAVSARIPPKTKRIVGHNKIDLVGTAACVEQIGEVTHVYFSAKTGEGIEGLREALLQSAGWREGVEDVFIARERHLIALRRAAEYLKAAAAANTMMELFAEELRGAQQALNEITGHFDADDLLGEIFSRFCIGK